MINRNENEEENEKQIPYIQYKPRYSYQEK